MAQQHVPPGPESQLGRAGTSGDENRHLGSVKGLRRLLGGRRFLSQQLQARVDGGLGFFHLGPQRRTAHSLAQAVQRDQCPAVSDPSQGLDRSGDQHQVCFVEKLGHRLEVVRAAEARQRLQCQGRCVHVFFFERAAHVFSSAGIAYDS